MDLEGTGVAGNKSACREAGDHRAMVAAYREGLGLAAITVVRDAEGLRIAALPADDTRVCAADGEDLRWWCKRASDATRITAAATARLRRESQACRAGNGEPGRAPADACLHAASESIIAAAKQLNVVLYAEQETWADAMTIVRRVEAEIERLRRAGEMKSVNASYRAYRLQATARGERVIRYADWMNKYKEKLVRELAATLRYA